MVGSSTRNWNSWFQTGARCDPACDVASSRRLRKHWSPTWYPARMLSCVHCWTATNVQVMAAMHSILQEAPVMQQLTRTHNAHAARSCWWEY